VNRGTLFIAAAVDGGMKVHLAYFTERPYRYAPQDRVIEKGFFGTPNSFFDAAKGYELYHEYLDEKLLAEDLGFDGVGLNEHHGTPFTLFSLSARESPLPRP
jgi:hypothetical protein